MFILGLTGGIASGKSLATSWLRANNIPVIDADELARQAVQKDSLGYKKVVALFGDEILEKTSGEIDRKKLGQLVFNNPRLLAKLESIVHPLIEEMRKKELKHLEDQGHPVVVYSVPLLFEKGIEKTVDKTILITAPKEERIRRIMERDNLDRAEALIRINSQWSDERKVPLAYAIIVNDQTPENFHKNLHATIFRLIKSK